MLLYTNMKKPEKTRISDKMGHCVRFIKKYNQVILKKVVLKHESLDLSPLKISFRSLIKPKKKNERKTFFS